MTMMRLLVVATLLLGNLARGHIDDHQYKQNDHIELWVNKVCSEIVRACLLTHRNET